MANIDNLKSDYLCSIYRDDPILSGLIKAFLNKIPIRVAELRACYEQADFRKLNQTAHSLKGALQGYGFLILAENVTLIEMGSNNLIDLKALDKRIKNLESLVRELQDREKT